ncbi:MAG: single-stranded-DNA-specific exonuclease RecJ [Chitinophagaceae bacterium]|nr:single-stranded-DNA-specific exonuclease RecJ [Chitinophagaceae bacterium]
MQKKWKTISCDEERAKALQQTLNINPVLARILVQRGMHLFDSARNYFRPSLSSLHDPWLMKDMEKAVDRILSAFFNKEKILVFGDYDVDGTTAVACMYQFLLNIYDASLLDFYIPHRYREGYGVSKNGIDMASQKGITLIISLDCGIKSTDLIAYAKGLGIDFIVCDHHMPDPVLPNAVAILNPKQPGCNYPYKDLCGCGVGFKLISALSEKLQLGTGLAYDYLDLVATAIAADIVPITGENRVLAHFGVKKINENPCPGIKALLQLSGTQKALQLTNVVFVIAPRINAAGRMDDARKAVQLFIEKDLQKALAIAKLLHSDNTDRREADANITEEALAMILNDTIMATKKSTVVFQPHWHKGVVGIVASRLIERYYRPTIVLTQSGEVVAGSARSVTGFNLYEAIHACREHLIGYGGHYAAAGMTLLPEQVPLFMDKFEEVVAATISSDCLVPEIVIDSEVRFSDLRPSFYNILCQMEPFGPDNMRPVFIARNVVDSGWSKVVKDQHIKFSLQQDKIIFNGIGFNMADKFHLLEGKNAIDLVFTLDENEWNNQKHLQLKVIDIRPSTLRSGL